MEKDTWFDLACVADGVDMSKEVKRISDWYDSHDTVINPYTVHTWSTLSQACESEAKRFKSILNVRTEKRTGQPYISEREMFEDIKAGWLLVSVDNDKHPLASAQDTHYSRIWHDLTHYQTKANFGFLGETQVCFEQIKHVSRYYPKQAKELGHALYLDIVAQVASGLVYRRFPEQKTF